MLYLSSEDGELLAVVTTQNKSLTIKEICKKINIDMDGLMIEGGYEEFEESPQFLEKAKAEYQEKFHIIES